MSDSRYKQALNNIDSDMRICLLHLERQIKEIKISPLKSVSELEKKVLNAISQMEKNNKHWEKLVSEFQKTADEVEMYTPSFLEKNYEKYLQKMENIGKRYEKLFDEKFGASEYTIKTMYEIYEKIQKIIKAQNKKE